MRGIICGACLATVVCPAVSKEPGSQNVSVKETWHFMPRVPWYRPSTGELTVVPFAPRAEPPYPTGWRIHRPSPHGETALDRDRERTWIGSWPSWLLLLLLLLLVTIIVVRTLRQTWVPSKIDTHVRSWASGSDTKWERLPFDLPANAASYLARSREAAERQQFGDAVVYLFAHALVALDRRHLIRLESGKTNGTYARELQAHPSMQQTFARVRQTFEDYFFGGHEIDGIRYESCRRDLEQQLTS